jgi:hypothetical protein
MVLLGSFRADRLAKHRCFGGPHLDESRVDDVAIVVTHNFFSTQLQLTAISRLVCVQTHVCCSNSQA